MTYIPNRSRIDSDNSSTATLTSGSTYTGTWVNVEAEGTLIIAAATDQDGTLTVQFSPDGTNIDSSLTRYYRTANINPPHRFTITRGYYRVTFENTSASNQTYFRLQTKLSFDTDILNIPIGATISPDYDSISTRPTNYHYEVALGRRQGHQTWNKWGYNADIDSAANETIWSSGGLFSKLASAETLDIVSSSANDTNSAGSGAKQIIIYGVDGNYEAQLEVIALNGVGTVTTSNTWLGVNRVAIYTCGATGYNEGTITLTASSSATVQAEIPIASGSTQHAFYFVAANSIALLDWLWINIIKTSGGSTPIVTLYCYVTSLVSGARYEVFRVNIDVSVENTKELKPSHPFVVGEKSLIEFIADTDTNNTSVNCRFSLIEVKDIDA